MKKVIIIDDEPLARRIVKEYLSKNEGFELLAECSDGFEGLKMIQELKPDLIFLDIQMPKITGFELLEILPDPPFVIFTTGFDEFALKAFDLNAVDYLLKPFSLERFNQAIVKFISSDLKQENISQLLETPTRNESDINRIVVKDGSEIRIIPTLEIDYLEAYDDYVKIHTKGKSHLKKQTMNYFETALNSKQFVRVHRSFIINIDRLAKIESFEKNSYVAILTEGSRVPISRSSYGKLKEVLGV